MENFYTESESIKQIIKSLELTKTLFVSSIIIGEENSGKKTLLRSIFPNTPMVSGRDQKATQEALEAHNELIITDFEKLQNSEILDFEGKRIIASANYAGNQQTIDRLFAFIYDFPSPKERPEDTKYLKSLFVKKAKEILMIDEDIDIDIDQIPTNLSKNNKSLQKEVHRYLTKLTFDQEDIEDIIYSYLYDKIEGNDTYRKYLSLYEKPLIEAGLAKYGSQLKLSDVLGINRNTLRKKIYEHKID